MTTVAKHDERCRDCKRAVALLLEGCGWSVECNYGVNVPARLSSYEFSPHYLALKRIYEALQQARGFREFVRVQSLPRVDYFLTDQKIVVEFDESQHFTALRATALEMYSQDIALGFARARWLKLCRDLDRHDNDPEYRDEQRAWYDTLRDFYGIVSANRPTARLFASDRVWCHMDPQSETTVRVSGNCFFTERPNR
jgi:hypothetical protein